MSHNPFILPIIQWLRRSFFKKHPPNFSGFTLPFEFSTEQIMKEAVTLYQSEVPEALEMNTVESLGNALQVAHQMGHLQLKRKKPWAWKLFTAHQDWNLIIEVWMRRLFPITLVTLGILCAQIFIPLELGDWGILNLLIFLCVGFMFVVGQLFEHCSDLIEQLLLFWVEQKASDEGVKLLLSVSRSEQQTHNIPAPTKKDIQILKQLMGHYAQWCSDVEHCQNVLKK
ncbi:MAG: hypothetical protein K2X66_09650 [Cyanobacteria bacterium]|nr:hypothetical protein [Cyanobacteriota bacterium]